MFFALRRLAAIAIAILSIHSELTGLGMVDIYSICL
jgi:hypothetical protein